MKTQERNRKNHMKIAAKRRKARERGMMKTPDWKRPITAAKPERVMSDKTARRRTRKATM